MAKQTAVEWLQEQYENRPESDLLEDDFKQAKQMERQQMSNAMMYALDEDGHTGDWKVKFINDYYESNFGVRPE